MVVILQPASRRPFSMLPVTIFTVMMNNCQGGGGGVYKKNSSTKNTKSSLLVPSLYIQAQQRGKPAELGKQPEF